MDFKDQVKASADIAQVIGEVVRLVPAGSHRFKGLCPFHNEKTPSFNVDRSKQAYYCFGCQKGGDVFRFVMEIEGIGFFDALKMLAERQGIPIPKRSDYGDAESRERDALLAMQRSAQDLFCAALNVDTKRYLASRNVTGDAIDEFGLGYAPSGNVLAQRLQREGFSSQQMAASGLIVRRDDGSMYDRFRSRVMFPIHNESGQLIAFGGRALGDDEPKYLNSSETKIYTKKRILYNLHRAKETIRKSDYTILVEGYMDVIGVSQSGVKNVVASCGTALSEEHVRSLRRHSHRMVVNFDPDAAGSNAAERSIQMLLEESMRVRVLQLDGGLDPDEYIAARGPEEYRKRAESADSYFHWLADRARSKFDTRTAEGRMDGFRTLLKPALEKIPDKLERLAIVNDLAAYLGVESRAILDQLKKTAMPPTAQPRVSSPSWSANEQILIRCLLEEPNAAPVLAGLQEMESFRSLPSYGVLQSILSLSEDGDLRYESLDARLSESDRRLLAVVMFADKAEDGNALQQLRACIESLEAAEAARKHGEIRRRVKELEKAGRFEEALQLMRESSAPKTRPPVV